MALKEVCIAAHDFPGGAHRAKEGEIVCVRDPLGHVGKKEQGDFLWLLMDEADIGEFTALKTGATRKYVDLADLKTRHPALDLTRVRDGRDKYQPMIDPSPTDGRFRAAVQTTSVTVKERANPSFQG